MVSLALRIVLAAFGLLPVAGQSIIVDFSTQPADWPITDTLSRPIRLMRLSVGGNEVALPPESNISVTLADGQIAGFAGMNWFRGTFRISSADQISFIRPLVTTRRAGPPQLMTLENSFLNALGQVTKVEIHDGSIMMTSASGSVLLEFAVAP